MDDVIEQPPAGKKRKWLHTVAFIIGIIAVTVALIYLLYFIEDRFSVSMRQFAWLAYLLVFFVAVISSSTIVFPAPGMAVTMAVASMWNPVIVALIASIGAALGELTAYYAGYLGKKIIIDEQRRGYRVATRWMKRYGMWAVFFFALIPILIFDLVGLVAGALKLPVWQFFFATWAGRIPRSFIEAYIGAGVIPLIFPSWFL